MSGRVPDWAEYSTQALLDAGLTSIGNLLRSGGYGYRTDEDVAVAYDFLCDLAVATDREDVYRTAEFLLAYRSVPLRLFADDSGDAPRPGSD